VHKLILALHLLFAIFAIGPLVHSATTASRGVRQGDAGAVATSARMARVYGYASVLVVVAGFGSIQKNRESFSDTWIWLSAVLWLVAVGLVVGVQVPALERARTQLDAAAGGGDPPARSLVGRVAAVGGTVGLIFAAIVFLMVYKPGR
jgi:uncharacterized membrane protein